MKLNKKQFIKWLQALRSGEYKQGRGQLQTFKGYCCLGVACAVIIPKKKQKRNSATGHLYGNVPVQQSCAPQWLKDINKDFTDKTNVPLDELNDLYNYSFERIANILEDVYIKNTNYRFNYKTKRFQKRRRLRT